MTAPRTTAAVVGAGMSGSMCAHRLAAHGFEVTVFDKARGPGGRTTTRRIGSVSVDHGAQYFTARDPRFRQTVDRWLDSGVIARWSQPLAELRSGSATLMPQGERYVGVPGMSAMARDLLGSSVSRFGAAVQSAQFVEGYWRVVLTDGSNAGPFDVLVVATPPAQALALVEADTALPEQSRSMAMLPCWATVLTFPHKLDVAFAAAFVEGSELSWIARDSSKPGRESTSDVWVLHASAAWSQRQLESPELHVQRMLSQAFETAIGAEGLSPQHLLTHRWRYARPESSDAPGSLYDPSKRIGFCGDWLTDGRVEAAALSGMDLANRIIGGVTS